MTATLTLGQRVRRQRTARGLTLREVADAIGMSKTWVADLERGRHLPTDEGLLERLAFCLRDDWAALRELAEEERAKEHELIQASQIRARPMSFNMIEEEAHRAAELLHPIENSEGEAIPIIWDLTSASETGRRLGLKRELRLKTFSWEKADDPEGHTSLDEDGAVIVGLRQDVFDRATEGAGRDRFTAAHELGHALLHAELLAENPSSMMFRDWASTTMAQGALKAYESPEWQANVWASAYLMPLKALVAYLVRQRPEEFSVAQMAQHFGVSVSAAQIRLEKVQAKLAKKWTP